MNFLSVTDLGKREISDLIKDAIEIKRSPDKYSSKLRNKILLMFFEQPSLRTHLSFQSGIIRMGGHAIYYHIGESTIGKKETYEDFASVVSRYCDFLMIRVADHKALETVAKNSSVPVINGMTNREHPCQVLGDLMTIWERFKTFKIKLAYLGDGFNNVTHSLLLGAASVGMDISVASPKGKEYEPDANIVKEAKKISGSKLEITNNAEEAVKDAEVIYTDSWMSYRIPENEETERIRVFSPYQVNKTIVAGAKSSFIFMHNLPAKRGQEVTGDIIDGKNSIIYDQAENRMHAQNALLMKLAK